MDATLRDMIHLVKLAVQCTDIADLAARQINHAVDYHGTECVSAWTRRKPRQDEDILKAEGSLYWVFRNKILCRQRIHGFEPVKDEEFGPSWIIMLDKQIIRTQTSPKRPFQGWRYLKPTEAPKDTGAYDENQDRPPPEMEEELKDLGLL